MYPAGIPLPGHPSKSPTMTSSRSNLPDNLRGRPFQKGHDPRRSLAKGGRPTDEFEAEMQRLAASPRAIEKLRALLEDDDVPHDTFLKALAHATDRGFGKTQQHVDVTTSGPSIAEILRKGRDRVARMRAEG